MAMRHAVLHCDRYVSQREAGAATRRRAARAPSNPPWATSSVTSRPRSCVDVIEKTACPVKNAYTQTPVNLYASTMHANSIRSGAYAFAYDDVCEKSSNIGLANPTQLTITLMPLDVTWSKMTCSN